MTTTLLTLRDRLQVLIGDTDLVYADKYTDAINNATRETYPILYRPVDDRSLITGNLLPPFNWATTSTLSLYTAPTGTLAKETDNAYFWRGPTAAKVTASGADDYLYLTSDDYPRLLDLMGLDIDFKCWAYPETANDAFLTIYTLKETSTGTVEQTLNSTTVCPATKKTLLELEDQSINDDIQKIEFWLRVHTDEDYVYFDLPRVMGRNVYEYLLPKDFQDGSVRQVYIQTTGYSNDICDDLHPRAWDRVFGYEIRDDGTYKYLRLPSLYTENRQIRLIGDCHLEILDADTDTISLDHEGRINLLLSYAAYLLFQMEIGVPASEDISRYQRMADLWYGRYMRLLPQHRMMRPSATMNFSLEKD